MLHSNAARATQAAAQRSPREDRLGGTIDLRNSTKPNIRATLIGADACSAAGITARGHVPTLSLCRQLLAAGIDPNSALDVYRRGTLALRIRNIGVAAGLTVKEPDHGRAHFAKWKPFAPSPVPSAMRQNGGGVW